MPVLATVAITAGASAYGASQQSSAAKKAAGASQAAADASIAEQRRQYDLTRADNAPWRAAGVNALAQISDPAAINANFKASPDFNFRFDRGVDAVNQGAIVAGGLHSGSALKALDTFGQGIGGQEFGNWFSRESALAGLGQSANAANQNAGQTFANANQNALTGNASNLASSYQNGANALTTGAGNIAGSAAWGVQNYPWKARTPVSNGSGSQAGPQDAYSGWY